MLDRELIIDVATKLLVENGVKTVTIDRIVKELHTSKRTLYHHFKDKTELLRVCLGVYHAKVREENERIIDSADNAIEAMAYLHQRIVRRSGMVNPNFFNDIFWFARVLSLFYVDISFPAYDIFRNSFSVDSNRA